MKKTLLDEMDAFFNQLQDLIMQTSASAEANEEADDEKKENSASNGMKRLINFGLIGKILLLSIIFLKKTILKFIAYMIERSKFEAKLWKRMLIYFSVLLVFFGSAWLFFFLYISAVFFDFGFSLSNSILISFGIQFLIALIMFVLIKLSFKQSLVAKASSFEE